jgi:hypothetical protein
LFQTNSEADLFGHVKYQLGRHLEKSDETLRNLLDELLDISNEVDLINEIKDIHDELVMIESVLVTQSEVLDQMEDLFTSRKPNNQQHLSPQTVSRYDKIVENLGQRRVKVRRMESMAHKAHKSVSSPYFVQDNHIVNFIQLNNLFDLKQKQANVLEVRLSISISISFSSQQLTRVRRLTMHAKLHR